MSTVILRCLRKNEGQDLSEYCLITAFIALVALAIFWHVSGGIASAWSNSNTSIAAASGAAGAGATSTGTTGTTSSGSGSH